MEAEVYNPFKELDFSSKKCFLTGRVISPDETLQVFPKWLLDRYDLHEQNFMLLGDGNYSKYKEITIPCSNDVYEKYIRVLEEEIQVAFCSGYDAVKALPRERLFQWMAKLVYGVLYRDLKNAKKYQEERGEKFKLSNYLEARFRFLHVMMQSIVRPIHYNDFTPWSIEVVKVNYSKDVFNYKDETNKLNFSLGMNGFGIVACLQDNGENSKYHSKLVEKIGTATLHPIQFEELCGRFIYSNYLLNLYPEYKTEVFGDRLTLSSVPYTSVSGKPLFNLWEDEMYGQVLANYWKPWGIAMKDILVFPNPPISFLESDYSDELIDKDSISLPF